MNELQAYFMTLWQIVNIKMNIFGFYISFFDIFILSLVLGFICFLFVSLIHVNSQVVFIMVFKFITDLDAVSAKYLVACCYNLFLLYFYYDLCKFLITEFHVFRSKTKL